MVSTGDKLINGVYPIEEVTLAYESLQADNKPLMVLLDYGQVELGKINEYLNQDKKVILHTNANKNRSIINVALVGSGGFATGMHMPNIENKYKLHAVMSRTGHSAKSVAKQYGATYATTNLEDVLNDKDIDLVMIATRHDSHASLVLKACICRKTTCYKSARVLW